MFRLIMCLTMLVSHCAARPNSLIAVGMDQRVEASDAGSHHRSADIFVGEALRESKLQPMAHEGCSCTCDCQDDEVDCTCTCKCEDEEDEHRVGLQTKRAEEIRLAKASVIGEELQRSEEQNIVNERRELFYRSLQRGSMSFGAEDFKQQPSILSASTNLLPTESPSTAPSLSPAVSVAPTVSPKRTLVEEGHHVVEQSSDLRVVAAGRLIRHRKQ